MGLSPTQRTLEQMKKLNRRCGIVEKFNPHVGPHGKRFDLFGFIDIIVIDPEDGIIGIQSCGQGYSDHVKKIEEECADAVADWVAHAKAELWGWRKVKKVKGGKAMVWKPRIGDILVQDGKVVVIERKPAPLVRK